MVKKIAYINRTYEHAKSKHAPVYQQAQRRLKNVGSK